MNCNTTHYRANSSSVPGDPTESDRKIGEAYLAIAAGGRDPAALSAARAHLQKAREDLLALQQRNELGRNHQHKLALIAAGVEKAAQLSARQES